MQITVSKYTTQIRFICESSIPLDKQGDYTDVDNAIESGRSNIFNFEYNLFDNTYKSVIERKFLLHNYTREIGFETVALFKLKLQDLWLMKLPYYNKLWESALIEFNPMYDVNYNTEYSGTQAVEREDETTSNGNTSTANNTKRDGTSNDNENLVNKYSDTPQGALDGVIDTDWLTNATTNDIDRDKTWEDETDSTGSVITRVTGTLTSDVGTTDNYIKSVVGKMGGKSYSKMLQEFRDTFINIDEQFINEFKNLFMLIY